MQEKEEEKIEEKEEDKKEEKEEEKIEKKEEDKKEEKEEEKKEDKKEEKEEEKKGEDTINWREELGKDDNFTQATPFDFKKVYENLEKASKNPDKLNPYHTISAIYDLTKFFKDISSALSMGFSDITEKSQIMRQRFQKFENATDIQDLLTKEMELQLNIYKLNGDNNKELGHGSDEYKNYISACRTFLRLLWFLEYLIDVFESVLKDDGSSPIKTILGNSYDKILAPHHPFLTRKAVGFALMFSSGGNVSRNVDLIFGYKEYNEEARKAIKETIEKMKIIWNGGNDYYKKHNLLELK